MRTDRLKINKSRRLTDIKNSLRSVLKEEHTLALKSLDRIAKKAELIAKAMCPVGDVADEFYSQTEYPGALRDSISFRVSRSPRYPGLIGVASAMNPKTGYDYALAQEENDDYEHETGKYAHFMEYAFEEAVNAYFEEMGYD